MEFIRSLKLGDKLSPAKNYDIAWFYLFLPALIVYFSMLMNFINEKPIAGHLEAIDVQYTKKVFSRGGGRIEFISQGLSSTDSPLWMEDDSIGYFVFSDKAENRLYKWEEGKGFFTVGKSLMLKSSGCSSNATHCSIVEEPGTANMIRNPPPAHMESLVEYLACQQGDRSIALIRENGTQQAIATHFKSRRFNSPYDLIRSPEGHIYFTDPRSGLLLKDRTSLSPELPFSGIYFIRNSELDESLRSGLPTKNTTLVARDVESPRGLAFSPDFSKVYVANGDIHNAYWKVYDVADDGSGRLKNGKVFFNATELSNENGGVPSGLKVDIFGNVFASGPGGVLVINSEGQLLTRLKFNSTVSNVAFGSDGRLYITLKDAVARVFVNTKPVRYLKPTTKGK